MGATPAPGLGLSMYRRHGVEDRRPEKPFFEAPTSLTRRHLLEAGSALIGAAYLRPAVAFDGLMTLPLTNLAAFEAVERMRRGELKAEDYSRQLLEQCVRHKDLNAFISFDRERVLERARAADIARRKGLPLGLLHGLPIPIKDSISTHDYATTAGTPGLRHFRPGADAPVVARLRDAGALILGKTNLHELSYGWTSRNEAFGAVHNPYDPTRIPGGSSGGTAVAVAAHMAPLGLAEDTEGSIRVPAALCGIVGFRPTTGRYPTSGAVPCSARFDQVGPHARTVDDVVLFDRVVSGDARPIQATSLAGIRLARDAGYFWSNVDTEVARLARRALSALEAAGVKIIDAKVENIATLAPGITDTIVAHDMHRELDRYLRQWHGGKTADELIAMASPELRPLLEHDLLVRSADYPTKERYTDALERRLPALRAAFDDFFSSTGAAAHVFPTTLVPAPTIGEEAMLRGDGGMISFDEAIGRNITPGSTVGLPGLVLPIGLTSTGLPVALEFDAPAGNDRALLALGQAIESVLGRGPPPPRL